MHLLSLKIVMMLKMQFMVVMDMNLMATGCELNLLMGDRGRLWTGTGVTVAAAAAAVQGVLTIAYWSLDYLPQLHGKI